MGFRGEKKRMTALTGFERRDDYSHGVVKGTHPEEGIDESAGGQHQDHGQGDPTVRDDRSPGVER